MNFKKCSRCGNFYLSKGDVCPKCSSKDSFELTTFKTYIEQNGTENSIEIISQELGIQVKHLNRFLGYEEFKNYVNDFELSKPQSKNNKKVEL